MAVVVHLPRVRERRPFEDERREIVGGWRAAMLDDDLTVVDRIHLAAANHADAEVVEFKPRNPCAG